MAKRFSELDPLLGWSRTGAAQHERKVQRDRAASREISLPERKSTLELGDELLAVQRGTETVRMTADDLILDHRHCQTKFTGW
jgi:hypothetical protein